jgi:glycosyltransferase involved in cell wall biosynthesis
MSRLMSFAHDQIVQAGHSVDYFCSEDVPASFRGRLSRFVFPLMVLEHARSAARKGRPFDVINVHEPSGAAISLLKATAGNPRVVVMSYGVEKRSWGRVLEESRLGRESFKLKSRMIWPATVLWQARLAVSHADHVFCSNMEDRDYLVSEFHITAERVTRIHSGAHQIYAEAGCTRDYSAARTLLFAGTWIKRKGTCDLIPAFSELAARHPQLKLVVLNGGVPDSVVKESFPVSVRPQVVCRQAEPEKPIADEMSRTDIYLLPSLFEGTPLTLIEAMFEGMPIVTTATCGMKDVISDGRNGLLAPIRSPQAIIDAVERLLGDASLRAQLGRTARCEALARYSWQSVAEPMRQVYEQLCS